MKRLGMSLFLVTLSCMLASCGRPPAIEATPSPGYDYGKVVAGIVKLHLDANANWPEHFEGNNPSRLGTEFDPSAYFGVLQHLSMEDGFVLDYVYKYEGGDGFPLLYARRTSAERFRTYEEYEKAVGDVWEVENAYLDHVSTDGSPEGFFELVLLYERGDEFYLAWHGGYRWSRLVVTRDDVIDIVIGHDRQEFGRAFTQAEKSAALSMDVEPHIQFVGRHEVTVSIASFGNWRGFSRRTYHFRRDSPHKLIDMQSETLVNYECGIRY